jgi:hypothetical protein
MMKNINRILLCFVSVMAAGVSVHAQSQDQNINITVKSSQTVEERVADSIKEKELREAAEEKLAAAKSARAAAKSPQALLATARTIYVSSNTSYFESVQLQNALRKRAEFDVWEMAILDGWKNREVADITIEIDRPIFTFTFTYTVTDRATGMVLSSGKITAFDGNAAAPLLAERIMKDIRKARGETRTKK